MSLPFPNIYNLRTVAEASSKACYVCHRPSVKVLITQDNKVRLPFPSSETLSCPNIAMSSFMYQCQARTFSTSVPPISAIEDLLPLSSILR